MYIGQGLRTFEPQPMDEIDTRVGTPLQTTTPRQWVDFLILDMHQFLSTRRVFSSTRVQTYDTLTPPSTWGSNNKTRIKDDGPRNFDSRSSDEDDTRAGTTLSKHPTKPTEQLRLDTTGGLLAIDLVILNHGQVTRTTPELVSSSPNYHTTPMGGRLSSGKI
ncbi:hypothetical protein TNCV_4054281 [Trichonephila clavipes]|nr:hypothetical protein TNCV_4054281 [Trichonephila clavipes]